MRERRAALAETDREEELACLRDEAALPRRRLGGFEAAEDARAREETAEASSAAARSEASRLARRVQQLETALAEARTAMDAFEADLSVMPARDAEAESRFESPGLSAADPPPPAVSLRSPSPLGLGGCSGLGSQTFSARMRPASPSALSLGSFLGASPSSRSRDGSRAGSPAPDLHTIHEEGEGERAAELARARGAAEAAEARGGVEKERRKASSPPSGWRATLTPRRARRASRRRSKQALAHAEKLEREKTAGDEETARLAAEKETLTERCGALEEDLAGARARALRRDGAAPRGGGSVAVSNAEAQTELLASAASVEGSVAVSNAEAQTEL